MLKIRKQIIDVYIPYINLNTENVMLTSADIMSNLLVYDFITSVVNRDDCSVDTTSHASDEIFQPP
jgi:hypothetical protein